MFNENKLYAKQENMNLTLTLLDNVTKVCEKWNIVYLGEWIFYQSSLHRNLPVMKF